MCNNRPSCPGCNCHSCPPCSHCVEDHDRIDGPHHFDVFHGEKVGWENLIPGDHVYLQTQSRNYIVGREEDDQDASYLHCRTGLTLILEGKYVQPRKAKKTLTLGQYNKQRASYLDEVQARANQTAENAKRLAHDRDFDASAKPAIPLTKKECDELRKQICLIGYMDSLHNAAQAQPDSSLRMGDPHLSHL